MKFIKRNWAINNAMPVFFIGFFYPLPMMMEYLISLVLVLWYFHFTYGI